MSATPPRVCFYPEFLGSGLYAARLANRDSKKIPNELSNSSTGIHSPPAMADFTTIYKEPLWQQL